MTVHYTDSYLLNPQHKITVNLVGLGGTGSRVLNGLVSIDETLRALDHPGIHVRAWDHDEVTAPNIGRQLYYQSDIGLNKAIVLISRINRAFGFEWEAMPEMFQCQHQANILITCVDSAAARVSIADGLKNTKINLTGEPTDDKLYWLDFGNLQRTGQVILGTLRDIKQPKSEHKTRAKLPDVLQHFPELRRMKHIDTGPSCSLAEAVHKQDLFINPCLANLGLNLLWKLLRDGLIVHHGLYLNLETMSVNPIKIK